MIASLYRQSPSIESTTTVVTETFDDGALAEDIISEIASGRRLVPGNYALVCSGAGKAPAVYMFTVGTIDL